MRKHFRWYLLASLEILFYLLISFNLTSSPIVPDQSTVLFREILLPSTQAH